ncbi:MAG: hypothetical protein LBL74_05040 [Bacteroidales bacterium]|nr:hypothetical protein [Bacteroidales bacterium]
MKRRIGQTLFLFVFTKGCSVKIKRCFVRLKRRFRKMKGCFISAERAMLAR